MTTQEQVSYIIEVSTKGREEIAKLKADLAGLTKTEKEGSVSTKDQSEQNIELNKSFDQMTSPLREVGSLFQKLNPTVLLASLGLGAVVGQMASLNAEYGKRLARESDVIASLEQYSGL